MGCESWLRLSLDSKLVYPSGCMQVLMLLSEAASSLLLEHKATTCLTAYLSCQGIMTKAPAVWPRALIATAEALSPRMSDILVRH